MGKLKIQKYAHNDHVNQIDIFGNTITEENGYTDVWLTPKETFDLLNEEFNFKLDPCTESDNPLGLEKYFTEKDNGLSKDWKVNTFCNPPYSKIEFWVRKAFNEFRKWEKTVVMLIPSRTDTKWFHETILPNAEVRFVRGRLKFNGKSPANFPSMVVVFGNEPNLIGQERNNYG